MAIRFFPEVDWNAWKLSEEVAGVQDEKKKYAHTFQTFTLKK